MLCSVVSHQALVTMLSYRSFFFASSNIDPGPHMASFERGGGGQRGSRIDRGFPTPSYCSLLSG